MPINVGTIDTAISSSELNNAGIVSGSVAYYAVYSYVVKDFSSYDERG